MPHIMVVGAVTSQIAKKVLMMVRKPYRVYLREAPGDPAHESHDLAVHQVHRHGFVVTGKLPRRRTVPCDARAQNC